MKARSFIAFAFLLSIAVLALLGPGGTWPSGPVSAASPSVNPADPLFSTAEPSAHVPYDPFTHPATLPEYPSEPRSSQLQTRAVLAKPAGIDLDVTYISRALMYNRYKVGYTTDGRPYLHPGTENDKRWPDHSEIVTFTAHFINKGTTASGAFGFRWLIDGVQAHSGTHPSLSPGEEGTETYPWAWAHTVDGERLLGQHTVQFEVDPDDVIAETYESNNGLNDRTDAISLVLALTPELYEALETPVDPQWPFSAEDWLQKQIAAMNAALARSVYPSAPDGVEERVRLDKILVTSTAPPTDWSEDGGFYMSADDRTGNPYYDRSTDVSGALLHELTHQLGIIDIYNLDVPLEIPQVLDRNGHPVQMELWASSLLPGLMGDPGIRPPVYSEHTTLALNANKGYRRGYYGEYLYDVPAQTTLRVLDNQGNPAPGVTINLYQRASSPNMLGSRHGVIDNTPEISVATTGDGTALLPNRTVGDPVSTHTGHTLGDNPFGVIDVVGRNDEFLLELSKGTHQEYLWLDITQFNLAARRGETTIEIASHVPPGSAPAPPAAMTGMLEYGQAKLHWQPSLSSTVSSYNVYRTAGPADTWTRMVTATTALSYTAAYDYDARAVGYAATAVDDSGGESGFSDLFWALRLRNPMGIAIDASNQRIILDPQNGYALLLQSPDGVYLDTLGSFDLHLENSQYVARAPAGRLLISHPRDWYSLRHSIRVTDQEANLLFEFGELGSGPGQFETPAGVAVWGDLCTFSTYIGSSAWHDQQANAVIDELRISDTPRIGDSDTCSYRILVADSGNHRIQAFDVEGDLVSTFGGYGNGPGEFYNPRGLAADSSGNVVVADRGNDRLQVLDFDGANFGFIRVITAGFDGPTGVAAFGSDRIIVADTGNDKVKVLDAEGNLLAEYGAPNDGHTGAFKWPRGVTADRSAHIVVADTGNRRVVKILNALPARPPTQVVITGPTMGFTQTAYTFMATASPITTTLPITYLWQATGQSSITNTGGLSDTISFIWGASGTQAITVTATNTASAVTGTHAIHIVPGQRVYLPLVLRSHP